MESIEKLKELLTELDAAVAEWEPDPARTDWLGQRSRAKQMRASLDALLEAVKVAVEEVGEQELTDVLHARAADLCGEVAVYIHLSGDPRGAGELLSKAMTMAVDSDQQAALAAGKHDPDGHVAFMYGRWLANHERFSDAERVLTPLIKSDKSPALAQAAREILGRPRPMGSVPSLFRLNGCGQSLYGRRDTWPDESYVATLCICLLFIPVFPIRAYRVVDRDGGWAFAGVVPLSPFARIYRWCLLGAIALGGVTAALVSHFGSDQYRAGEAMEEAREIEANDKEEALRRYRQVIDEFGYAVDISEAAQSVVRLTGESVPSPCTHQHVDLVGRVVNAFYDLPEHARPGAESLMVDQLLRWSEEIGDASAESARARVAVLDMATQLAEARARAPRAAAIAALADKVAAERPLIALSLYMSLGSPSPAQLGSIEKIIDGFGEAPSLWLMSELDIRAFVAAARAQGLSPAADAVQARLDKALARADEDRALIEDADAAKLEKALEAQKDNQELAAAVANKKRDKGDQNGAIATLEALGKPGRMTGNTHQLLGMMYRDAGRLEDADALLTPFVEERMTAFQQAQRAYSTAVEGVQERVMSQLRSGTVPPDLEAKLNAAVGEEQQGEVIRAYLREQIASDPQLSSLQMAFLRHEVVVPASMTLGMVKLARANGASGPARAELLAAAERAFLAIRGAAEGQPSYHLGLGEVYHRLGKSEDGDRELGSLLEQSVPELTISVATVYRNLGKQARAREILEQLYASPAPEEMRQSAAYVLSLLAVSLDDQAKWLGNADQTRPEVKAGLIDVRGSRAAQDGDFAAADAAYAESARIWRAEAEHNPVAINNEAVAYMSRYAVTGDQAHLKKAASRFDEALKLSPDAPLTMQNLADALRHVGLVELLTAHFKVDVLVPDNDEASQLVGVLLDGEQGEALRAALISQPQLVRALELSRQLQVLAPHRYASYRQELSMLLWQRDAAGLEKLYTRLKQGQTIDVADTAQQRRKYERGEMDAELQRMITSGGSKSEQRRARAKADGDPATIAATEMFHGDHLFQKLLLFSDGDVDAAIAPYRAAAEVWPNAGTKHRLASALLYGGVLAARADSPALAKAFEQDKRVMAPVTLAALASRTDGGAEISAALGKQPYIAEAVSAGRAAIEAGDDFGLYLAAVWAGDEALRKAGSAVFDRRLDEWSHKLEALLYPGERREASELEVYEAAATAR